MQSGFHAMIRDRRGNIAMMFGLMLFVIVGGAGVAIDLTRSNFVRTQINEATDAAILAAARYRASHPNASDDELSIVARRVFDNEIENQSAVEITSFKVSFDDKTDTFVADAKGVADTLLMGVLGDKYVDIDAHAEVRLGSPPLVEIAMALDVTGSMNKKGKIAALRNAARELVESLYESDDANVKIAMVPFAQYANVGADYATASWLQDPGGFEGCVGSRDHPYDVTGDDFAMRKIPGLNDAMLNGDRCPPPLTPLSADDSGLKMKISNLVADGSTYIPAGLFLAWQLLTPEAPFTEAVSFDEIKKKNGVKALILMTDGENTRAPDYPTHESEDAGLANDLTEELCANIKKQEIVLYTIAFDLTEPTIKDILENCATSHAHYFDAENAKDLSDAFAAIASGLRSISLSK